MKIVYCLNSISDMGGIAVVTIVKANALADIPGNEVHICVSDHKENELSARLSPKVRLTDLGIDYYADDWKSRWAVLKGIVVKRRKHRRKLAEALGEIAPDIVISAGQSEKYMLPGIKGGWSRVRELHYASDYRLLSASGFFGRLCARLCDLYDFGWKIKRYDHVVLLTEEDRERCWRGAKNVSVIPNPLTFSNAPVSDAAGCRVISAGRLEAQKNYASLIRAFAPVAGTHPEWSLEIYGDGSQREELLGLTDKLNLSGRVFLRNPVPNVADKLSEASFFVLSSIYEGLPLVVLEAMSCGLPVVAYSCPCGPRDIITDGEDGFLVPAGDEAALAERLSYLIEHPERRAEMGRAARAKADKYRVENIVPMWMTLFRKLRGQSEEEC